MLARVLSSACSISRSLYGGVQRDDDAAGLPHAELGDEELGAVGQQQRHTIALAQARAAQRGAEGVAFRLELGVRHRCAFEEAAPACRRGRSRAPSGSREASCQGWLESKA
jgi:hypothetical protein